MDDEMREWLERLDEARRALALLEDAKGDGNTAHNWNYLVREARQRIVGQLTENARGYFSGKALRVVS